MKKQPKAMASGDASYSMQMPTGDDPSKRRPPVDKPERPQPRPPEPPRPPAPMPGPDRSAPMPPGDRPGRPPQRDGAPHLQPRHH